MFGFAGYLCNTSDTGIRGVCVYTCQVCHQLDYYEICCTCAMSITGKYGETFFLLRKLGFHARFDRQTNEIEYHKTDCCVWVCVRVYVHWCVSI